MTQSKQILIKPLNINFLEKGSYIVGFVEVVSRLHKTRHKAAVYHCPAAAWGKNVELYKIVLRKRRVIGYCLLCRHGDELHIPLLGSLDLRYHVGKILSGIAVERMFEQDCVALRLTASWNSLLHHYNMGFEPLDQKKIKGQNYDKIIASRDLEKISQLGSIVMYLPKQTLKQKISTVRQPLLNDGKNPNDAGFVEILNNKTQKPDAFKITKSVNARGVETYTLVRRDRTRLKAGSIVLNYFRRQKDENGHIRYVNFFGEYPEQSVFYRYGSAEYAVNKTFAEYWSIPNNREYLYQTVLETLFQIALEVGKRQNCPRLQIEADWDEHLPVYEYGFRTQDFTTPKTAAEISRLLERENFLNRKTSRILSHRTSLNLNKLGSVDMIMTRDRALQKGWQSCKILNHKPSFFKRWWYKLRNFTL